jgi:hypothetical protein
MQYRLVVLEGEGFRITEPALFSKSEGAPHKGFLEVWLFKLHLKEA